jgi:signal transduction histidine kinase
MPLIDVKLAPIPYPDVARGLQLARAVGGILLVATGIVTTFTEATPASTNLIIAGGVVAVHAVNRIRNSVASPFGTIFLDTSLAGALLLSVGAPDLTAVICLSYLLTVSALLLAPTQGAWVIAYLALWSTAVVLFAPLGSRVFAVEASIAFSNTAAIAVGSGFVLLLAAISVASLASRTRHASALETEREAVRLKDEFVSMVSHELRTPITSIAGFIETLREDWRDRPQEEVDEFLRIVATETLSLSRVVEDILVIPRIDAGRLPLNMTVIELRPLCLAITDVLAVDTVKDIEVAMPAGIMVHADLMRLQQVIRNLVVNAIKYGGDQILIQGIAQGQNLQAVVSDNGPGVDEADRERIFEHFEQGTSGDDRVTGIGLGLPIALKLMQAMGGDLWFEPRFPIGSNFFFTLKVATAATPAAERLLQGSGRKSKAVID